MFTEQKQLEKYFATRLNATQSAIERLAEELFYLSNGNPLTVRINQRTNRLYYKSTGVSGDFVISSYMYIVFRRCACCGKIVNHDEIAVSLEYDCKAYKTYHRLQICRQCQHNIDYNAIIADKRLEYESNRELSFFQVFYPIALCYVNGPLNEYQREMKGKPLEDVTDLALSVHRNQFVIVGNRSNGLSLILITFPYNTPMQSMNLALKTLSKQFGLDSYVTPDVHRIESV